MSANIPFELQVEIIKRVPVKSLIQFRSVSKQWKSLIDSSEFITHHSLNQTQPHHLLVQYTVHSEVKYVSVVDDDHSVPHHEFSPTVPLTTKLFTHARMLGSSHGLVCLHGFAFDLKKNLIVLWNPSIRKSVDIMVPKQLIAVGFGVCPKTSDPKIVKVTRSTKAEVYTLSSGAWRRISMKLRVPGFRFSTDQVVMNGIIYWVTCNSSGLRDMIISFDLTSEEFGVIELQDSLAHPGYLPMSKYKESLVLLNKRGLVCDVWMMSTNGDPKSLLTKLFTVSFKASNDSIYHRIIGFRKNGQPIIEYMRRSGDELVTTLEVYEPCNDIGTDSRVIITHDSFFMMTSYTESLLLLNHPDSNIQ